MTAQIKDHQAVLVYFNSVDWRWYLPRISDLKAATQLEVIGQGDDGAIYGSAD